VDKALGANMTRDTVNRAIQRGVGGDDDTNMETIIYEGYGPNGVAVIVDCLSDNRKRTVSEVRHAFSKSGGNLGTDGSVSYMFAKKGVIIAKSENEDELMEIALDLGAEDITSLEDNLFEITCPWESFNEIKDAIAEKVEVVEGSIDMIPSINVSLDADEAAKLMRLVDMLEDCDDVQEVYHNADISDEIAESL
ncbi:MAG: YebC/PmpR family DNA-binding transcriptional regulator, partial [Psittacicella sp.]